MSIEDKVFGNQPLKSAKLDDYWVANGSLAVAELECPKCRRAKGVPCINVWNGRPLSIPCHFERIDKYARARRIGLIGGL